MELFPAVLIGGPPHSGKSVLSYSLTQALRAMKIQHYVLRAYPDGEGDWSNETDQSTVRAIRVKGEGTKMWVAQICRDIANRQLPLIVDVGGRPAAWQEEIFNFCTHAVLLTPDEDSQKVWQGYAQRYGLLTIANLRSELQGKNKVDEEQPVLRGVISGLERGQTAQGVTFKALLRRLAALFSYAQEELRRWHLSAAPVETVLDLPRLAETLTGGRIWQPQDLPLLLDYLPAQSPLALYNRAPNWVYAALALHAFPAPLYQFDPRLGWVKTPPLKIGPAATDALWKAQRSPINGGYCFEFSITRSYLDYSEAAGLLAPPLPPGKGLLISGKLPMWLWTALARIYQPAPWLAIYQPQVGAVVVSSSTPGIEVGNVSSRLINSLE